MKDELRKEILKKRRELASDEVSEKSEQILERLKSTPLIDSAHVIMCYMDFRNEVETANIIEYLWSQDKVVVLPKVNKEMQMLELYQIEGFKDMIQSNMGILEPSTELPRVLETDIDLILAPGVAFDLKGYRMGYGGGFYDKLIPNLRADCHIAALAFEIQLVEKLPVEAHDQPMSSIITEARWLVL